MSNGMEKNNGADPAKKKKDEDERKRENET